MPPRKYPPSRHEPLRIHVDPEPPAKAEPEEPAEPVSDGLIEVVLTDPDRMSATPHRIDPEQRRFRIHANGVTYEHCDTLPDGTWRYAPSR